MNDEGLISKKELLERYGISYGALYRWKRKGLIPDEWFIKRATTTGQETFFPERMIFRRVETILAKKEDVLLDELAKELSGEDQKKEYLVLDTEFGTKSFCLSDLRAVHLVDRKGERQDITLVLKQILENHTTE